MELKLHTLFEYQKYEKNKHLQNIIDDSINKYESTELFDDELEYVNAAGMNIKYNKNQD